MLIPPGSVDPRVWSTDNANVLGLLVCDICDMPPESCLDAHNGGDVGEI